MLIKKKILPEFFELVLKGKKKFEIRLDNFNCKEGDILVLQEWDPLTKQYTGREISKKVSLVLKTKNLEFLNKEDINKYGLQIIQLD